MGQLYHVNIQIGDNVRSFSPAFQTEEKYASGWKSTLEKIHKRNGLDVVVSCGCKGKGKKFLCVRHYASSDTYRLAKYANTGFEHEAQCMYFSLDDKTTGLKGYQHGVIREGNDGLLVVKLNSGLNEKDPTTEESPARPPVQRPEGGQSQMTLVGLHSLLWTEACLNCWHPGMAGKRSDSLVRHRLLEAAQGIRCGKTVIADILLVGTDPNSAQAKLQDKKIEGLEGSGKRLLIMSTMARYDAERHEKELAFLPLRQFGGLPLALFSSSIQWANTIRRFPAEYAAWKSGERVAVLALTSAPDKTRRGHSVRVNQIALLHVSKNWIPLDSSYEQLVADKLDAENRNYLKPMRFDASQGEVFPDFVLVDTRSDSPFPLEVFGMATPAYLARKQLKMDYYNRQYGPYGWWYWDATLEKNRTSIPSFPEKK